MSLRGPEGNPSGYDGEKPKKKRTTPSIDSRRGHVAGSQPYLANRNAVDKFFDTNKNVPNETDATTSPTFSARDFLGAGRTTPIKEREDRPNEPTVVTSDILITNSPSSPTGRLLRKTTIIVASATAAVVGAGVITSIDTTQKQITKNNPTDDTQNAGGIRFGREYPVGWEAYGSPISRLILAQPGDTLQTLSQRTISEDPNIPKDFVNIVTSLNESLNKTNKRVIGSNGELETGQQYDALEQKFIDRVMQAFLNPGMYPELDAAFAVLNGPHAVKQKEKQKALDTIFGTLRKLRNSVILPGQAGMLHEELAQFKVGEKTVIVSLPSPTPNR